MDMMCINKSIILFRNWFKIVELSAHIRSDLSYISKHINFRIKVSMISPRVSRKVCRLHSRADNRTRDFLNAQASILIPSKRVSSCKSSCVKDASAFMIILFHEWRDQFLTTVIHAEDVFQNYDNSIFTDFHIDLAPKKNIKCYIFSYHVKK